MIGIYNRITIFCMEIGIYWQKMKLCVYHESFCTYLFVETESVYVAFLLYSCIYIYYSYHIVIIVSNWIGTSKKFVMQVEWVIGTFDLKYIYLRIF